MLPTTVPKNIDKYFFNRKKDIKQILHQIKSIEEDLPNQILLTGKRGVGKTFLLKKILHDQNNDILTVYIDISKIYGKNKKITEEEILKTILNKLNDSLKNHGLLTKVKTNINSLIDTMKLKQYDINESSDLFNISIPKIKDNYAKLSELVMELPQNIVDATNSIKGIIIVIDEFQLIKHVKNPEAFFWLIRSHLQNQSNICYIFTGSVSNTAEIIEMINGQTGAFGGRMIQINIEPFTKKETKNYLNEKLPNISFNDKGFDKFYQYTNGIPAYINTFSNVLDSGEIYDSKKVEETFLLKMDQIVIMWLYIWGRLTNPEKEIITLLVENNELTWNELLKKCNFSKATLSKYIDSLNNQGIIRYNFNDTYVLNDEMIRTWLSYKKENEGQYPI